MYGNKNILSLYVLAKTPQGGQKTGFYPLFTSESPDGLLTARYLQVYCFHRQVVDNFSLKAAHTDTPSRFFHVVPEYIHAQ